MPFNITADASIAALDTTFGCFAPVRRLPSDGITRASLATTEVLLVRTATRVDAGLLEGTPVRFVGSAAIGTDHLDTDWLDARGIGWAAAPGCNAAAASQYTLGLILLALERLQRELAGQAVGIVGFGNVGSRLARLLDAAQVPWVACDPPLAAAGIPGLVSLEQALSQPIVSLHVPLTRGGAHPTWRLLGARELAGMPAGGLLVNAARGDVVDGLALLAAIRSDHLHAALDVWPGEPELDSELLRAALVATPHVAGYSLEGKTRATEMVYAAFRAWAGLSGATPPAPPEMPLPVFNGDWRARVLAATRVRADEHSLRPLAELPPDLRATAFEQLRSDYVLRREADPAETAAAD